MTNYLRSSLFGFSPLSELGALAAALEGGLGAGNALKTPSFPPSALAGLSPLSGLDPLGVALGSGLGATNPLAPPPVPPSGLAGLAQLFPSQPATLWRLPQMSPLVPQIRSAATKAPELPARRNVFFSFHYGADVNRATIVRKAWAIRASDELPGFFDRSLWESKKYDHAALRGMIRDGLQGTSVTCVLAGEQTYARPWVRFEIAASVEKRNGFLTAHVWPLYCIRQRRIGQPGPDPLSYMGVFRHTDDKTYVAELWDGAWRLYPELTDPVPWPKQLTWCGRYSVVQELSQAEAAFDYHRNGVGRELLPKWINYVAARAR